MTEVRRENWAESWKRHFKPLEIGRALLLKPSWSRRRSQPGQAVVVLDPGLSFGTGQHPTTRFCLEQLVACRSTGEPRSFLDVGTGSGILAIAAAKLDYGPVRALDCDPEAVRIARRNAKLNQVHTAVRVACQDLAQLSGRRSGIFDLVCANLIADVLLAHRSRLISLLSPHGRIVLAGILKSQFRPVQAAYEAAGLRLVNVAAAGEWKSGAFEMAPGCQGSRHPVHFGAGRTKKFHK